MMVPQQLLEFLDCIIFEVSNFSKFKIQTLLRHAVPTIVYVVMAQGHLVECEDDWCRTW